MYSLLVFNDILKNVESIKKFQLFFLIIISIISSTFEIISIASLIPFVELMFNNESFVNSKYYEFIENLIPIGNYDLKLTILFLFIGLTLLSTVFRIFVYWFSHLLANSISKEIISNVYSNIIYQNYDYFISINKSKFTSILDKINNTQAYITNVITIIINLCLLLGLIVFILNIGDYEIFFIFLIIGTIFFIFSFFLKNFFLNLGKDLNNFISQRYFVISETFKNIKQLIIYNSQNIFVKNFKKINLKYYNNILKNHLVNSLPPNIIVFLIVTTFAIAAYYFSTKSSDFIGKIPLFAALIYSLQKVTGYYSIIFNSYNKLKYLSNSSLEILSYLKLQKFTINKKTNINFLNQIEIKDGFFSYEPNKDILKNVNLKIKKGSKIFISGNSGEGKSTLIDIICGFLKLNSGYLSVDNLRITENNLSAWFNKISYTQQISTFVDGTILENIIFSEDLSKYDVKKLDKILEICEIKQAFNSKNIFDIKIGEDGLKISGGQKQRISLARSLYKNKDLIVLDESTNSLDEESEKRIMTNIFENYNHNTILITSHRNKLKNFFDEEINVKNGIIKKLN